MVIMKKRIIGGMLFIALLLGGCGADEEARETAAQVGGVQEDSAGNEDAEGQTEEMPDTQGEADTDGDAAADSSGSDVREEAGGENEDTGELEIDEATREELTAQLLLENQLDISVMEEEAAGRCTFTLPEDFTQVEDIPGMYVTKRYPIDASTIYYAEMDKDISMQLMTEETYVEQIENNFRQLYDMEVEVEIHSFEKIRISRHPAFRILCSYEVDDVTITQLEYVINADKSYVITYSQTDEYDRMEEFLASAATIELAAE